MDPKFAAGVICFSTRRKSPVAGPSGEPCISEKQIKANIKWKGLYPGGGGALMWDFMV